METLRNKVAVITGATSGIGEGIARAFAAQGMRLVLTGRDEAALAAVSRECNATQLVADITHPDVADSLLQTAVGTYGCCDIVVNNAGMIENGWIEDIDLDRVCHMVRTNVEAAFRVAYTFVRYFRAQDAGDLVNISSVMGTKVRDQGGAYAGTKHALEALSETMRMELAHTNVRVTCIQPGLVRTELHRNLDTHPAELWGVPEPLTPQDIADCVLYVLRLERRIRIPCLMILPKDHVI